MKKLPIGVEDYSICQDLYYVDKTLLLKDIIDYFYGKSVLITRPRRFGKSLNISMIEYYFSIEKDSHDLFNNKKIFNQDQKYLDEMNKYPVIHLNMKNVRASDFESLKNKLIDIICLEYRKHTYLLENNKILDIEKNEFQDIISKKSLNISDYLLAIYKLSILLNKHFQQKVIVLIDEYDAVIEDAFNKGFYNETINLFKEFYSSFLKGNENLKFAVLTGVLQIAKESIFSDLNNLDVYSVEKNDLHQYFGFTQNEVLEMFKSFNLDLDINEVSKWYGGYGTKDLEIYNPWSILNLVNSESFDYYWTNTGSNETVSNLIKTVDNAYYELNKIINDNEKLIKFNNSISYKDISYSIETIISYLVQSGYLIVKSKSNQNEYNVKIPNTEIQGTFERELITRNMNHSVLSIAYKLRQAVDEGDSNLIKDILNEYVLTSFSYYDLRNYDLRKEKEYQTMLTGIFAVLFTDYLVKTEVNNKNGRCDMMIIPKNHQNKGFVFEIKYLKGTLSKTKLENSSLQALRQIKKQEYYSELLRLKIKDIYIYGLAFDDRHTNVNVEKINN